MPKKKKVEDDKTSCQIIASSLSEILRYSLDEDFKKSTLELLNVSSPKEAEKIMYKKLMAIVEECSSNRKKKNSLNFEVTVTGKENEQPETCSQENSSQTVSEDLFSTILKKRNWLQISTKQYKENIKRKRLGFFSQPVNYQSSFDNEETGLHSFSLSYNDSISSTSNFFSNASSQDASCSSDVYDEETNFCKKKFKELFNKDVTKYFKINLKSKKNDKF